MLPAAMIGAVVITIATAITIAVTLPKNQASLASSGEVEVPQASCIFPTDSGTAYCLEFLKVTNTSAQASSCTSHGGKWQQALCPRQNKTKCKSVAGQTFQSMVAYSYLGDDACSELR